MTTYLGKNCFFGLPSMSFVNAYQFVCVCFFPYNYEGGMWDLILFVSFYFNSRARDLIVLISSLI